VKLFAGASFCELCQEETCQESLGKGEYILRVSGSGDSSDTIGGSWGFCGLTGGVPSEVAFSWMKGKCSVLQSIDSDSVDSKAFTKKDNKEDSLLPLLNAVSMLSSSWGLTLLVGITAISAVIVAVFGFRSYVSSASEEGIDNTSRSTAPLVTYFTHRDRK